MSPAASWGALLLLVSLGIALAAVVHAANQRWGR